MAAWNLINCLNKKYYKTHSSFFVNSYCGFINPPVTIEGLGTVPGTGDLTMMNTHRIPAFRELTVLWGERH